MPDLKTLHRDAIIIDLVCPLLMEKRWMDLYRAGGVTAVTPTVGGWSPSGAAMKEIGSWLDHIRRHDDLILARSAADIRRAKAGGKTAVLLHFQGADPVDDDLNLLDIYKALGLGILQLTYNIRNRVADGALEDSDGGLSGFGRRLIRRCNELGIIVDVSHTGRRSVMEAIEVNKGPIIFSHTNAASIHPCSRNADDATLKAVAATGGVIGVTGYPGFLVKEGRRSTLADFVDHIDHIVALCGIDHAGLAIDYYIGQNGICPDEKSIADYDRWAETGSWGGDCYPRPPHYYPQGMETPDKLFALIEELDRRGYAPEAILKVLGGNWLRVLEAVWGG